ncbi:hypothetical protein ACWGA9_40860 [Streptomyces sp. NPDC054950]
MTLLAGELALLVGGDIGLKRGKGISVDAVVGDPSETGALGEDGSIWSAIHRLRRTPRFSAALNVPLLPVSLPSLCGARIASAGT